MIASVLLAPIKAWILLLWAVMTVEHELGRAAQRPVVATTNHGKRVT